MKVEKFGVPGTNVLVADVCILSGGFSTNPLSLSLLDLRTGITYDVCGAKRKNVTSCWMAREHRVELTFLTLITAKSNFALPF